MTGLFITDFDGSYHKGSGLFYGSGTLVVGTWDGFIFTAAPDSATWQTTFHG